jgi:beta-aspartyl-peptidase (threonine type)
MQPAIVVHGGAWRIDPLEHADHLQGVEAAVKIGWAVLEQFGMALDAVEQAVMSLEDDPTFDAGTGSVLTADGDIELDAMLMDGRDLRLGAVGAVQHLKNPIQLARLLLNYEEHNMLVGPGAVDFAQKNGLPFADLTVPRELERFRRFQENPPPSSAEAFNLDSGGTVGAVAIDQDGNIAAATSTGGTAFRMAGRVGDSPLVGSGAYADNETGGASATGHGERIMEVVLAKHATDLLRMGIMAQQAAEQAIAHLDRRVNGRGGIIMIDHAGTIGFAHNTPHMAVAWYDSQGNLHSYIEP